MPEDASTSETAPPPPLFRLADNLLDGHLEELVSTWRAEGKSWRWVTREIWLRTNHEIDVTYETLRNWFPELTGRAS